MKRLTVNPVRRAGAAVVRSPGTWTIRAAAVVAAAVALRAEPHAPGDATSWAGASLGDLSFFQALGLLALTVPASLVARTIVRERRITRIVPFRALGEEGGPDAALAAAFGELLEQEIRRINALIDGSGAGAGGFHHLAPQVGRIKPAGAISGADGAGPLDQVGTLEFRGLKLSLGALLQYLRTAGPTVSGCLLRLDHRLQVVATYTGRPRRRWEATMDCPPGADAGRVLHELASRLAYQMVWALSDSTESGADPEAFGELVDGLGHYRRYLDRRNPADLDRAEERFLRVAAIWPRFAAAHHNLGVVYQERHALHRNSGSEGDPLVHELAPSDSERMFRRALELDPALSEARLALAQILFDRRDSDGAVDEMASLIRHAERAECARARDWLGRFHLFRPDASEPDFRCAVAQLRRAKREYQRLRRRASRHGAGLPTPVDGDLAEVTVVFGMALEALARRAPAGGAGSAEPVGLAGVRRELRARVLLWRAERAYRAALRRQPGNVDALLVAGRFYVLQGSQDAARAMLSEALEREPADLFAIELLGEAFESVGAHRAAAAVLRWALEIDPDNAERWVALAQLSPPLHRIELAGVALALDPWYAQAYHELSRAYGQLDGARAVVAAAEYAALGRWADDPDVRSRPPAVAGDEPTIDPITRWVRAWVEAWCAAPAEPGPAAVKMLTALARDGSMPEARLVHDALGRRYREVAAQLADPVASRACAQRALEHLERATTTPLPGASDDDTGPRLWNLDLAEAYLELELHDEAIVACGRALERAVPTFPLTPEDARRRYGHRAEVRGEPRHLFSVDARALALRAAAHRVGDEPDRAIADYEHALRIEPELQSAHAELAALQTERGDYDRALASWRRYADLPGHDACTAHLGTAVVHHARASETNEGGSREQDLVSAAERCRLALGCGPARPQELEARQLLATALDELGRDDEALAELERARGVAERMEADGKEVQGLDLLHLSLAHAYRKRKALASAEDGYREAARRCEQELGRASAGDDAKLADEVRSRLADALNWLAWLYVEHGVRLEEAVDLAERAVELSREYGDRQLQAACVDTRGWALYQSGDLDRALDDLAEALRLDFGYAEGRAHLALAYEARAAARASGEDRDLARKHWEHVLELDGDGEWGAKAQRHLAALAAAPAWTAGGWTTAAATAPATAADVMGSERLVTS